MVFIYLEFSLFPSVGNVPAYWGMAQNPGLGEFGKEPKGNHESDRFRFTGCLSSKVQIQDAYCISPRELEGKQYGRLWPKRLNKSPNLPMKVCF